VVLLISHKDRKGYIRVLQPGGQLHTHRGHLNHDDLIGRPIGATVATPLGFTFYLLTPTTEELVRYLRRESQIIFPKDAGYIIMRLGIQPGSRVAEAGTGSGGLTLTLATIVGDAGQVYSYDVRKDMQSLARRNVKQVKLSHRVTFHCRDAAQGFEETDVDAIFLDMLMPWLALDAARKALRGGGVIGCLVPTVNQLADMIAALDRHPGFAFVEAEELILRGYKTIPARVRPEDTIIGHTGYLIFGRAVLPSTTPDGGEYPAAQDEEAGVEES
jgi:tRNA (adenine57-N1/adenine58-N1)-methyltransferase